MNIDIQLNTLPINGEQCNVFDEDCELLEIVIWSSVGTAYAKECAENPLRF